jgi:hypothetical protein
VTITILALPSTRIPAYEHQGSYEDTRQDAKTWACSLDVDKCRMTRWHALLTRIDVVVRNPTLDQLNFHLLPQFYRGVSSDLIEGMRYSPYTTRMSIRWYAWVSAGYIDRGGDVGKRS